MSKVASGFNPDAAPSPPLLLWRTPTDVRPGQVVSGSFVGVVEGKWVQDYLCRGLFRTSAIRFPSGMPLLPQ